MNLLDLLHEQFAHVGIRYLVVGGIAVNAYGVDRLTDDVDILIEESDAGVAAAALERFGYRERKRSTLVSRLIPADPMLPIVDLLCVDSGTFDSMWRDAREIRIGGHVHRLPSPRHLIAMKLHALRHGHEGWRFKDAGTSSCSPACTASRSTARLSRPTACATEARACTFPPEADGAAMSAHQPKLVFPVFDADAFPPPRVDPALSIRRAAERWAALSPAERERRLERDDDPPVVPFRLDHDDDEPRAH